jgi:hypothetical protein
MLVPLLAALVPLLCLALLIGAEHLERGLDSPADAEARSEVAA